MRKQLVDYGLLCFEFHKGFENVLLQISVMNLLEPGG